MVWLERREGHTYDTADDQEPNHHHHDFAQSHGVFSLVAIVVEHLRAEVFLADVEVEDRGDADGAEKADDDSLTPLLDLVDAIVHKGNNGWPAEEENEDAQRDEAVDGEILGGRRKDHD
jgi:hypothetical protein